MKITPPNPRITDTLSVWYKVCKEDKFAQILQWGRTMRNAEMVRDELAVLRAMCDDGGLLSSECRAAPCVEVLKSSTEPEPEWAGAGPRLAAATLRRAPASDA